MGEEYVIGLKPYGLKIEFYSDPLPKEDGADLVLNMRGNMGLDANLYRCMDGKRKRVPNSELDKLVEKEAARIS
jgi:hypothetical protein